MLLDDMKRWTEAVDAHAAALRVDPAFANGHYNLALLCKGLTVPKDANRPMVREASNEARRTD
jgi:hypothetical protein